jgi:hypothetical protein
MDSGKREAPHQRISDRTFASARRPGKDQYFGRIGRARRIEEPFENMGQPGFNLPSF